MPIVNDAAVSWPSTLHLGCSNEASRDAESLNTFRGQLQADNASPKMNEEEAEQILNEASNSLGVDTVESKNRLVEANGNLV